MPQTTVYRLASDWRDSLSAFSSDVRHHVMQIALLNKEQLTSYFYERMLDDETARLFLNHEDVHSRLSNSMERWITELFSVTPEDDFEGLIELQKLVGEVHSRINLPLYLVLGGARILKRRLFELIAQSAELISVQKLEAQCFVSESIDIAIEFMSRAYSASYDRKSRAAESYRVFAAVHNSSAERGRQRAALLDWENGFMFDLAVGVPIDQLIAIHASEFGLWFRHKGADVFQNLHETNIILKTMERIDKAILPKFKTFTKDERVAHLRELRALTRLIGLNLEALFEKQNELEAGRDALTQLLGRKYLSAVLGKEVAYARSRGIQFALLAIDLDHFKQINDTHGHEAGDMVLQQFAELLNTNCRAGDYIFRLGGEEFLVLIVDVNTESASRIANILLDKIRHEAFSLPAAKSVQLTASMGLTLYDGHPDYEPTLRRADKALYLAKNSGRDKVELV